jgi:hypothetical protein
MDGWDEAGPDTSEAIGCGGMESVESRSAEGEIGSDASASIGGWGDGWVGDGISFISSLTLLSFWGGS